MSAERDIRVMDSIRDIIVELRTMGDVAQVAEALGLDPDAFGGSVQDALHMAPPPRASELFLAGVTMGLHEGVRLMAQAAREVIREGGADIRQIIVEAHANMEETHQTEGRP